MMHKTTIMEMGLPGLLSNMVQNLDNHLPKIKESVAKYPQNEKKLKNF